MPQTMSSSRKRKVGQANRWRVMRGKEGGGRVGSFWACLRVCGGGTEGAQFENTNTCQTDMVHSWRRCCTPKCFASSLHPRDLQKLTHSGWGTSTVSMGRGWRIPSECPSTTLHLHLSQVSNPSSLLRFHKTNSHMVRCWQGWCRLKINDDP